MLLSAPTAAATLATTATFAPPPVTTAFDAFRLRNLRQELASQDGNDYQCFQDIEVLSCDSAYISCLEKVDVATEDISTLDSQISSCYCTYGIQYLNCFYSALSKQNCYSYYGITDWSSYESDWFEDSCGTIPATNFGGNKVTSEARGKPPTSVSLDFESVEIVTLSSTLPLPTYTYTPIFQSTGNLLQGDCAATQFTLIEDTSTVYWAAYVGCASNQPQCCPWTAASEFLPATLTVNTTMTVTSTVASTPTKGSDGIINALNAFPVPANTDQGILKRCATDYYSISGACCPSNYWPFTRNVGGQTPCYSSLDQTTEAPTLTAGLVGQPTDTAKPTSAVVNVVWAMSYPVQSKVGLSKGAIAGIAVGTIVAVAIISVLSFCLWRMRKKNTTLQQQQQQQQQQLSQQPPAQQQALQPQPFMVQEFPANEASKQQGMMQVQQALPPGYGYAQQQVPPPSFVAVGGAAVDQHSNLVSSATPVSALVPQSTGTTVSDLSGGVSNASSGAILLSGSPHPVSTNSPAGAPGYPAPIFEADESAYQQVPQHQIQQQQQFYPQQQYYQQPQQAYAVPAQGTPVPFYQQNAADAAAGSVPQGYAPQPQGYGPYPPQELPQQQHQEYAVAYAPQQQTQQNPSVVMSHSNPVSAGPAEASTTANNAESAAPSVQPVQEQVHATPGADVQPEPHTDAAPPQPPAHSPS
ncbi:hypothetical protein SPI_03588 [Niveomyces insectorum RCEF 264]|uniref:Uncharacterized protein n=1 Tax=Niveomyces insectorum RCEF 264 TaxID=1081102 RepID=A0A167W787_9HYPO|nr:hypothetical protein SPI_03588 [Niveomyces insectorum RCEF 264]